MKIGLYENYKFTNLSWWEGDQAQPPPQDILRQINEGVD